MGAEIDNFDGWRLKHTFRFDCWVIGADRRKLFVLSCCSDQRHFSFGIQLCFGYIELLTFLPLPRGFSQRLAFFLGINSSTSAVSKKFTVVCVRLREIQQEMTESIVVENIRCVSAPLSQRVFYVVEPFRAQFGAQWCSRKLLGAWAEFTMKCAFTITVIVAFGFRIFGWGASCLRVLQWQCMSGKFFKSCSFILRPIASHTLAYWRA